jgi:hypothetical protein
VRDHEVPHYETASIVLLLHGQSSEVKLIYTTLWELALFAPSGDLLSLNGLIFLILIDDDDDDDINVNVKVSLRLTKHHAMKTYYGSGGIAPRILDLGNRWR